MAELGWLKGFVIKTKENQLVFDPSSVYSQGSDCSIFISHAHADHFTGLKGKSEKYTTLETRKIFENIYKKSVINFHDIKMHKRIQLGDVDVTPINAGHMLGSTQFLVNLSDTTILYTGDINYLDTLTTMKAEVVECDTLVMEATYGEPSYIFPDREETYASIIKWTLEKITKGLIPVFQVYAAGKAQELIKLFNTYTNLEIITDQKISRVNSVYSSSGLQMDSKELTMTPEKSACVYLTVNSNTLSIDECPKAITTGWALKMRPRNTTAFPLSSHSDFCQLLQFVKDCKAKTVYTFTGYSDIFTDYIKRKLGVSSSPLPAIAQRTLHSFRESNYLKET